MKADSKLNDLTKEVYLLSLASVDRKKKIVTLIEQNGKVKVKNLATLLEVTPETIRKYLNDLQKDGKLKKVYGGAISTPTHIKEPPSFKRESMNKEEKRLIGKKAVDLINDNDVIGIDEGSTPFQLAKNLKDKKNLTIVTSSINSLTVLINSISQNKITGKIILLGGEIDPIHQRVIGELSLEMLDKIYVDTYFISADGLSENGEITSYEVSKNMVTKKIIEHSNVNVLLIDHTKIGHRAHYKMTDLSQIDIIISNKKLPHKWINLFNTHNVQCLISEDV